MSTNSGLEQLRLTAGQISDLNQLAAFLACDDTDQAQPRQLAHLAQGAQPELLVLLGNSVLHTAERAFQAMACGAVPKILIAGGVGHSTELLCQAIRRHPLYHDVQTAGRSEAEMLGEIGMRFFALEEENLLLETQSTNSGDNALQARRVLEAAGENPNTLILTQDPLLQRRADATFRHVWRDRPQVRFINWPSFVPKLMQAGQGGSAGGLRGLWPLPRFIALILGEIPRLRNAPGGYGPRGAGFIAHVEIPPAIEACYGRLSPLLGAAYGARALSPRGN